MSKKLPGRMLLSNPACSIPGCTADAFAGAPAPASTGWENQQRLKFVGNNELHLNHLR